MAQLRAKQSRISQLKVAQLRPKRLAQLQPKWVAQLQPFYLTPLLFWESLNYALTALDLVPPSKKIPLSLAFFAAGLVEIKSRLFKSLNEPSLTKYGVGILAKSMTLDISKAKKQLNYIPVMSTREGINEYIQWYKEQK